MSIIQIVPAELYCQRVLDGDVSTAYWHVTALHVEIPNDCDSQNNYDVGYGIIFLTLRTPVITICATFFSITKILIFLTDYIYVFVIDRRISIYHVAWRY